MTIVRDHLRSISRATGSPNSLLIYAFSSSTFGHHRNIRIDDLKELTNKDTFSDTLYDPTLKNRSFSNSSHFVIGVPTP